LQFVKGFVREKTAAFRKKQREKIITEIATPAQRSRRD
jgi:hypothetical protein